MVCSLSRGMGSKASNACFNSCILSLILLNGVISFLHLWERFAKVVKMGGIFGEGD